MINTIVRCALWTLAGYLIGNIISGFIYSLNQKTSQFLLASIVGICTIGGICTIEGFGSTFPKGG